MLMNWLDTVWLCSAAAAGDLVARRSSVAATDTQALRSDNKQSGQLGRERGDGGRAARLVADTHDRLTDDWAARPDRSVCCRTRHIGNSSDRRSGGWPYSAAQEATENIQGIKRCNMCSASTMFY